MPSKRQKPHGFAVCLKNSGYPASLEVRKLYPVIADADAEENDLIRVVDESGEDYLYPAKFFQRIPLSNDLQRLPRRAS